jgi:hypothetical protein
MTDHSLPGLGVHRRPLTPGDALVEGIPKAHTWRQSVARRRTETSVPVDSPGATVRRELKARWRRLHARYGHLRVSAEGTHGDNDDSPPSSPYSRRADAVDRGEPIEVAGSEIGRRHDIDVDLHARYLLCADGSIEVTARG